MMHTIAYLDPGSAGVVIQIIAGGVAALAVSLKMYGRRLLVFLHLKKADRNPEPVARHEDR
jgi:hypothetical protein